MHVRFITTEIVHVTLYPDALLTRQLINELVAATKLKNRAAARAFIFSVNDLSAAFELFSGPLEKAAIGKDLTLALVCPNHSTGNTTMRTSVSLRSGAPQVFRKFETALAWTKAAKPQRVKQHIF